MLKEPSYYGWAELLDATGAVLERVWAALRWETGDADAPWSGQLTPQAGQADFGVPLGTEAGRVLGLRLLVDDDPVQGMLTPGLHYPPLLREGTLVRTAVLEVAGQGPLRRPPQPDA